MSLYLYFGTCHHCSEIFEKIFSLLGQLQHYNLNPLFVCIALLRDVISVPVDLVPGLYGI